MTLPNHSTKVLCVMIPPLLLVCRSVLEFAGYEVTTASTGQAGLSIIRSSPVDLAVIDNEMPGMSGLQLARQMKELDRQTSVLMLSGSPQPQGKSPIDDFLMKGEGPSALLRAVGEWTGGAGRCGRNVRSISD